MIAACRQPRLYKPQAHIPLHSCRINRAIRFPHRCLRCGILFRSISTRSFSSVPPTARPSRLRADQGTAAPWLRSQPAALALPRRSAPLPPGRNHKFSCNRILKRIFAKNDTPPSLLHASMEIQIARMHQESDQRKNAADAAPVLGARWFCVPRPRNRSSFSC